MLRIWPTTHHSLPGPRIADPLPPILSGLTAEVLTVSRLEQPAKEPLQLNLARPAPGHDGGLLINDIAGHILLTTEGSADHRKILDLNNALSGRFVHRGWEVGLLSFTLHPDFHQGGMRGEGLLYTVHSEKSGSPFAATVPYFGLDEGEADHLSVISEWQLDPQTLTLRTTEPRTLLVIEQPFYDHNAYYIDFNPTVTPGVPDYGKLYIGVGNGGRESFRERDRRSLFGTILRIDPLESSDAQTYGIPPDNPFDPGERRPEVWVEGLRNPQHFSWDPLTGAMYCVDIGAENIEEVNRIEPGRHYAWSFLEGDFVLLPGKTRASIKRSWLPLTLSPFTGPIAQYDHDEGKAIGSVFVYRGTVLPELYGQLVLADVPTGRIFYTDPTRNNAPLRELRVSKARGSDGQHEAGIDRFSDLLGGERADLRLARDGQGELLLLNKSDNTVRMLTKRR